MTDLIQATATVLSIVCTGLFAGAHVAIQFSSVPAMLSLDDAAAVRFFAHFYAPLARIQPGQNVVAALASLARLTLTPVHSPFLRFVHLLVVLHLVYILAWTATTMLGDNNRLLAIAEGRAKEGGKGETRSMLENWGKRNQARVWPGIALFVLLVAAETGKY